VTDAAQPRSDPHHRSRTSYLRDVFELDRAGADNVIAAEREVALAMTEDLLSRLGATPEQIDRERARVREELSVSS
jgi:CPA2 family monovalent cation:H+ antiporter-2